MLVSVAALYAFLTWLVIREGFLEYNADGFTRIVHGYEWQQSPRWEVGVWLPLQTWLFGVGLAIHDSVTFTPRAMNVAFTAWTLINLYFIGRTLGDRWSGVIAVAIGAIFPWTIWLGVSGMSEPLFHAVLTTGVLGFVRWLRNSRDRWLLVAGLGLLLATMVRYEGWFYAAVYMALVVGVAWRQHQLRPLVIVLAMLPMAFPVIWMQQHWQHFGDPLQFARDTAAIKADLAGENEGAGLLRRLSVYPEETMRLAPRLAVVALLAAGYALYRRVAWWPLIALIAGQALLFVGVSAAFSNLGPGAERYLLSNAILLFPVLGAVLVSLPMRRARIIGLAVLAYCLVPLLLSVVSPPTDFPGSDTRTVARAAADVLERNANDDDRIPVLVPPDEAGGTQIRYALQVLSNRPESWLVTSDPQLFDEWVRTIQPPIWVVDRNTGITPPDAEHVEQAGRYIIGRPDTQTTITLSATIVAAGEQIELRASGYASGERTSAWITDEAGLSVPVAWDANAGQDGLLAGVVTIPATSHDGIWSITVAGLESGMQSSAQFEIVEQP